MKPAFRPLALPFSLLACLLIVPLQSTIAAQAPPLDKNSDSFKAALAAFPERAKEIYAIHRAGWCGQENKPRARKNGFQALAIETCPINGNPDLPQVRNAHIPTASTPLKTVRLHFNIFAQDDGGNPASNLRSVDGQVQTLNRAYASSRIRFIYEVSMVRSTPFRYLPSEPADFDDVDAWIEYFDFIDLMKTTHAKTPAKNLNIFVTGYPDALGISTFPWEEDAAGPLGGIIIQGLEIKEGGHTLTHEIGHALGLWHTFQDSDECSACFERPDGSNGDVSGDFCSDTPATPLNFDCAPPGGVDPCTGREWGPTQPSNFMSYADDACLNQFTPQQSGRMQAWIEAKLLGWLAPGNTNTAPSISPIPNQTAPPGLGSDAIEFTIGDRETPPENLTVAFTTDNSALVPAGNIVLGGTGVFRTIQITPASPTGSARITLTVRDESGTSASTEFQLQAVPAWENQTALTIPGTGPANLYPSTIAVSNLVGSVTEVRVHLQGLSHTYPDDLDILLEGPMGHRVMLLSDIGSSTDIVDVHLSFADSALYALSGSLIYSGHFKPSTDLNSDSMPVLGTVPASFNQLKLFAGSNPNGVWKLYVADDAGGSYSGSLKGWTLRLKTSGVENNLPALSAIPAQTTGAGEFLAVPFVVSDPESSASALRLAANSDNQVLIPNRNLSLAGYGTNRTLQIIPSGAQSGSAAITLVVTDEHGGSVTNLFNVQVTPNPSVVANSTALTIPGTGTASLYPSTITLSNLAGSVTEVKVILEGVSHSYPDDLDILLEGPMGQRVMLLSDMGGSPDILDAAFVFSDAAAGILPGGSFLESGWYKPSTDGASDTMPILGSVSPSKLLGIYNGTNPNGVWKLYVADDSGSTYNGSLKGWTLNVKTSGTVNSLPQISAIPAQSVSAGDLMRLNFTVSDAETPASSLVVRATADNSALAPARNIQLSGLGTNRTLTILPAGNATGASLVTVTVTDQHGAIATASFNLQVNSGVRSVQANNTALTIPGTGAASLYPSTINVSDLVGSVTGVRVNLEGLSHTYSADLDILLEGPSGQRAMLLSDAGSANDLYDHWLVFDDAAPTALSSSYIITDRYKPSNLGSPDPMPLLGSLTAPASLGVFNGTNPNGTWKLYVADDAGTAYSGSLKGWTLSIATSGVPLTRSLATAGNLQFGDAAIGSSVQRRLTLTNTGSSDLIISAITYPPGFSGNWNSGTMPVGATRHVVVSFSPASAANYEGNLVIHSDAASGAYTLPVSGTGKAGPVLTELDVLILYTPEVTTERGGHERAKLTFQQMIQLANQVYANSGINLKLNAAFIGEINYTETGDMDLDFNRLRQNGDGFLDAAHTLRETYGADHICLVTRRAQYGGVAVVLKSDRSPESVSFSAYSIGAGFLSFVHELGHTLGSTHGESPRGDGYFMDSHGHSFLAQGFRYQTLMGGGGHSIPFFSNPEISYLGVPIGIALPATNAANDSRTLNLIAPVVSQVRPRVNEPPTIRWLQPGAGLMQPAGSTVILEAAASDPEGSVAKVEFLANEVVWGTAVTAPYRVEKTNAQPGVYSVMARVTDAFGKTTLSEPRQIIISGGPIPGWYSGDIGAVQVAGSTALANGIFTIRASGEDIWHVEDSFHFSYQALDGDGEIIARVTRLDNSDPWAKAGVMIRETATANSAHAFMALSPGNGSSFQARLNTRDYSLHMTPGDGVNAPYWVKLVRTGNVFTGYRSSNGTSWTQVGKTEIRMPQLVTMGLAVCSHNNSTLTTATFSNVATRQSAGLDGSAMSLSGDLAFGNISAGTNAQRTLTIHNYGNSPLQISRVSYPAGFSGNWTSGTIPPGASLPITVTFAPAAMGSYNGMIIVGSNMTAGKSTIPISGIGTSVDGKSIFAFDANPVGTGLYQSFGSALWRSSGGSGGGYLSLTDAGDGLRGTVVFKDFAPGEALRAFKIETDVRIGGGDASPADGFSISYARGDDDVINDGAGFASVTPAGETDLPEEGTKTGLAIGFDSWFSGSPDVVGISVRVANQLVAQYPMPRSNGSLTDATSIQTGGVNPNRTTAIETSWALLGWAKLSIELTESGRLHILYKGSRITPETGLQVNYTPAAGSRLVLAARTGGFNQNHHFDNIQFTANSTVSPVRGIAVSGPLAFGNVTLGSTSQRTFSITNTGNVALNTASISFPAGFSGNWSSGTIATGAVQNVVVTFAPTVATEYAGQITVASDATSGANTIAASGTGVAVPVITAQPVSKTVEVGQTASFTVVAGGTQPLSYQWQKNGIDLNGATSATLALTSARTNDAGSYKVMVSNSAGSVLSQTADLIVNRLSQSILFAALPETTVSTATLTLSATASSGLPIAYRSSDPTVATLSNNIVTIKGVGSATITASQPGDATYLAAVDVSQTLRIVAAGRSYDLWADYSGTNPSANQRWQYGWSNPQGVDFLAGILLASPVIQGCDIWAVSQQALHPQVLLNRTGLEFDFSSIAVPTNLVVMHPSNVGEKAVVRWAAPGGGQYRVTGRFEGVDRSQGTTDVAIRVVRAGTVIATPWTNTINSFKQTQEFDFTLSVEPGSSIDFQVGFGNGDYTNDSTGLSARIHELDATNRVISLSGDLSFGNVAVGSTAQKTLSITNLGNSALTVTGINYPTGFTGNWSSGAIATGAVQNVLVNFSPSAAAAYTGTIVVSSDATAGSNTIAVSGTGTNATLAGLEADLAPRPNGDGRLTPADFTVAGRLIAQLSEISTENPTEFIRADSAPRSTRGDGRLTAADWTQAGRYVVGIDAAVPAGGPSKTLAANDSLLNLERMSLRATALPRKISVLGASGKPGDLVTARLELIAQGNENTLGFSVHFDASKLKFIRSASGADVPAGTQVLVNTNQAANGRVGVLLALAAGQSFAAGTRQVLALELEINSAASGAIELTLADQPVFREIVSADADVLPSDFIGGNITVQPVGIAPTITAQPQSTNVLAGASVTFDVRAEGTAPLAFQWKRGGAAISGATSASLVLTAVSAAHSGTYSVVVSNAFGSIESAGAVLTVTNAPVNNREVLAGQINGAVGSSLSLPVTLVAQGDENTIGFSLAFNTESASYVSVANGTNLPAGSQLVINTNQSAAGKLGLLLALPAGQSFTSGTQQIAVVNFMAKVAGTNVVSFSDTPVFREVVSADANVLECRFTGGSLVIDPPPVSLPTISAQPQPVTVVAGGSASFTVVAEGSAPLFYQWKKNDVALNNATAATLTLTAITPDQTGIYSVTVSNAAGSVQSAGASLTVTNPPANIREIAAGSVSGVAGEAIAFPITLIAQGNENTAGFSLSFNAEAAQYVAFANGTNLPAGSQLVINTNQSVAGKLGLLLALPAGQSFTSGTQQIAVVNFMAKVAGTNVVSFSDTPVFREVVSADANVLECRFTGGSLVIDPPPVSLPTISAQPQPVTVVAGGSASFSVVAEGSAPLFYQWKKNDVALNAATAATLTLTAITPDQAGIYSVIVSNAAGSVQSAGASLTVTNPPANIREIAAGSVSGVAREAIAFPITLIAQGNENTAGFSLSFNAEAAQYLSFANGTNLPAGSQLVINTNQSAAGKLGLLLALPAGQSFTSGTQQIAVIHFMAKAAGTNVISFGDSPVFREVVSADADVLECRFTDGSLVIAPPLAIAPNITKQPSNLTVNVGQSATFSVNAGGSEPLAYQWLKNNVDIGGATSSTFTIAAARTNDAGNYTVLVSNSAGSALSQAATLTVNRLSQTISFAALADAQAGAAPISLNATASSGLAVAYTSSNPQVATVNGNILTIVGAGTTTITATQAGDATFQPAAEVSQTLRVLAAPVSTSVVIDFEANPATAGIYQAFGLARWRATGGNSGGYLSLTDAQNDQRSSIVLKDFAEGAALKAFKVEADVRTGGGTDSPADGFSISFARAGDDVLNDGIGFASLAAGSEPNWPEEGTKTGLSVCFDTWDNGSPDVVGISVRVDNQVIANYPRPTRNGASNDLASLQTGRLNPNRTAAIESSWALLSWQPLSIEVTESGKLHIFYKGARVTPADGLTTTYRPTAGSRLVLAARTGGANANHHFDNLKFTDLSNPAPKITSITRSGSSLTISWTGGSSLRLQKSPTLNNPAWVDVPGSVGVGSITISADERSAFFRLKSGL